MAVAPTATSCPICGSPDRVPYYDRPEAACADCGSLERQRALARELRDELLPRGNARCLEIAPYNPRVLSEFLRPLGWAYESLDKRLVREARDPGVFDDFIDHDRDLADLRGIPTGAYELVLLQHVLSEVDDDRAAMDEIARVTAPGGRALLEIPWNRRNETTTLIDRAQNPYGNRREYGRDVVGELQARFAEVTQVELREGLYGGTVFVCRARGGPAAMRTPPVQVGSVTVGVPLPFVAYDKLGAPGPDEFHDVEWRDFAIAGDPAFAQQHEEKVRRPLRTYRVRRVFNMSIDRCSLVGAHLVALQDDHVVQETLRGPRSLAAPRIFTRDHAARAMLAPTATQRTIEADVAAIGARGTHGYFHWMTEIVTRLLLLLDDDAARELPIVMRPAALPFQTETLDMLGVAPRFVEEDVVHVARAVIPTFPLHPDRRGRYSRDLIELSRRFAAEHVPLAGGRRPKRIFVSRADAKIRHITNEPDVTEMLERHGFERITLTGMSVAEQIALFAGAEAIVAQHGAGLTNMLFARPGTRVIELYPNGVLAHTPFWTLASLGDLDYTLVACDKGPTPPRNPDNNSDITVDVAALQALIK